MKTTEKLAILTALSKAVKAELDKTRKIADKELETAYKEEGIERKALMVNGVKVGNFIVIPNKQSFEIFENDAFEDFAITYGFAELKESIKPECVKSVLNFVEEVDPEFRDEIVSQKVVVSSDWKNFMTASADGLVTFLDTNEIVPGVRVTPESYKGTQVRDCKPESVIPILVELGGIEKLLLGGGE